MPVVSTILIFSFIGTLGARQPDIDLNRIKVISQERFNPDTQQISYQSRRSINLNHFNRKDDNDYNSRGFTELRTPLHFLHDTPKTAPTKTPVKIHQPREDPRLFYQSATYLKEVHRKNLNNDLSPIYPGQDVINVGSSHNKWNKHSNYLNNELKDFGKICVRCPHDRTLIAKAGTDRVILQYPRLSYCSGTKAPKNARFVHMYGPKFGSLIGEGSHIIVGSVTYKGQTLQTCNMQIHVLIQSCPIPKYLAYHCSENDTLKTCNFTCRDLKLELHGAPMLKCGSDLKWMGRLPVCRARTWCEPPPPPEYGRISCKGATAGNGSGLAEGASCRVRCSRGYRWTHRATAVCRRGRWTYGLSCQPKRTN
ncbi:hypothetical protein K1T71_001959 [Dendrolimus kikuchii]|uniref:Uncharacterized protein n=1 Tax=Dendrolimus kikuchii TaxID=765133 RepID=A0ACC1DFJ7_9NEOP|nr:hypothetical protein K1T71_001959 [Dendrolimus kikuchii]